MRSLYTDERGVSPVVATLLLISLFIGVYAIYMNVTIPSEFATKEKEHMSEVRDSFLRLQSAVQEMSAGESRSISVPMSANLVSGTVRGPGIGGRLVVIENESLYYEIQNAYYSPQTYIYENGAVILYQPRENKSIMVSPPTMVSVVPYGDNVKVTIRSVRLMSSGEVTGTGTETLAVSIITSETSGGNPNGVSGMPGDSTYTHVDLSSSGLNLLNFDGTSTEGVWTDTENFNGGWGHSFPTEEMPSAGEFICEDASCSVTFLAPDPTGTAKNFIKCSAETVDFTDGEYDKIHIIAASNYGDITKDFTVNYTDETSTDFSRTVEAWEEAVAGGDYHHTAKTFTHRHHYTTGNDSATVRLFHIWLDTDETKTATSMDLPTDVNIKVMAVTLEEAAAAQPPDKPTLSSPSDGTTTNDNTPAFTWTAGSGATSHRLVIDNDPDFADEENIYDNANLGGSATSCTIENELPYDNYYWKVIAVNAQGENESDVWTFEVVEELVEELLEKVTIVIQSNYPDAWRDYLVGLVEQLRDDGIYATIDLQNLQLTVHGESTDPGVKDIYVVRESKDVSIAIS